MRIICVSNTNWHDRVRPAELIGRLKNHRFFYFDPPPAKKRNLIEKRGWKDESIHYGNIDVFDTPPVPFWQKKYPQLLNGLAVRRQASYIKKRMAYFVCNQPVLWLTSPLQAEIAEHIENSGIIFDCPTGLIGKDDYTQKKLEKLCGISKLVLVSTEEAYIELKPMNNNTFLLPNGSDHDLFSRVREDEITFPEDLFNIKNPMLGFIGPIDEEIDLNLVEYAAKAHPEWSFVFLGETSYQVSPVDGLRNIHMLGAKPPKQLPGYIRQFDVCLNIYKTKTTGHEADPCKLFEYLSTGKPIVSTPRPGKVLDYSDVIYLASAPEEYTEACRMAIAERDEWKVRQRIAYGRAASWEARAAELELIFKEVF